jgi:NitT/TauT family transport system substrate-binding protein
MNRLTTFAKMLILLIIVGATAGIIYFTGAAEKLSKSGFIGGSSGEATLIVNTYCGFEPIVWGNGGLEGSDDSYFSKEFGLKLKIIVMDDFEACRGAFKNDEAQIAYCTLDALPVEMSSSGTMTDARYFMLLNHSAGADAIVVTQGISDIPSLKGKSVAFAEGTASHTLLLNTLETSGLTMSDIKPVIVSDGIAAAEAFKAKQVDAACVWAPDDEDCLKAVKGSKILTSTAQAASMVSDGLIAKKEWLENNKDLAKKIVKAILWANSEIKNNPDKFKEGAEAFAKAFDTDVDFALASASKINYATLADESRWLGFESDYTGMTGEEIYTKMSRTYSSLGLCKAVLPWSKATYLDIVEEVIGENDIPNEQGPSSTKEHKFEAPSVEDVTATAMSNKKVTINFPTAGYILDNEARSVIDREFVGIAKQFSTMRIRVEGNTDDTGNYDSNVSLSKARAQSVVNYLIGEGMPRNRFIVVGNGPKKAREAGVTGSSEAYRTTEFQLLP